MTLWFITTFVDEAGSRQVVTPRPKGSHVDKVHEEHAGKLVDAKPIGEPPTFRLLPSMFGAEVVAYNDANGFQHALVFKPKDDPEIDEIDAKLRQEFEEAVDRLLAKRDLQGAAALERRSVKERELARRRVRGEGLEAMHRRFPQREVLG